MEHVQFKCSAGDDIRAFYNLSESDQWRVAFMVLSDHNPALCRARLLSAYNKLGFRDSGDAITCAHNLSRLAITVSN